MNGRFRKWWLLLVKVSKVGWKGIVALEVIFALVYYAGHVLHGIAV